MWPLAVLTGFYYKKMYGHFARALTRWLLDGVPLYYPKKDIQYRSNVSYHRLARRVSFLSRRVSFLSRRVSFLSRSFSFLASAL